MQPLLVPLPNLRRDGTHVTRYSYPGCSDGAAVVLYKIDGGPGGERFVNGQA